MSEKPIDPQREQQRSDAVQHGRKLPNEREVEKKHPLREPYGATKKTSEPAPKSDPPTPEPLRNPKE